MSVKRYDNVGCPEEICRVDTMYGSDDGDYVLWEDYEQLLRRAEELATDVAGLVEALEGIMRVEARDRVMPVGAEWDAARAALAAHRKGGGL